MKTPHRFRRSAWVFALALTCGGFTVPRAGAAPVCTTAGLDTYIALNASGGCTVDNALLFNFAFTATPPSNLSGTPSASDVIVSPLAGSTGLGFSSSLFSLSDNQQAQSATYIVHYTVDPPPVIVGEDLSVDPPFGNVVITQNYCEFDFLSHGCAKGFPASQSVTPLSPTSSVTFIVPTSVLDVDTIFNLNSTPGSPAGFDSLDASSVTATPEPSSGFLTLGAIAGLSLALRRGRLARR